MGAGDGDGDVDKKPEREWGDLVDDDGEVQLRGGNKQGGRAGEGRCWDNWEAKAEWSGQHGWRGDGERPRQVVRLIGGGVGTCCV